MVKYVELYGTLYVLLRQCCVQSSMSITHMELSVQLNISWHLFTTTHLFIIINILIFSSEYRWGVKNLQFWVLAGYI